MQQLRLTINTRQPISKTVGKAIKTAVDGLVNKDTYTYDGFKYSRHITGRREGGAPYGIVILVDMLGKKNAKLSIQGANHLSQKLADDFGDAVTNGGILPPGISLASYKVGVVERPQPLKRSLR